MNIFEETKPVSILDFIADDDREIRKLDLIARNQITFPSDGKKAVLLHGRYGTGKTKLAKLLPAVMEQHRVDSFDAKSFEDIGAMFLSCSATGGSAIARKSMPTTVSFHQSGLHYVILDEVDNLRSDAQKNMKSFITEYDHVIYIMTTNHLSKVDKGLISRSHCISFEEPSKDLWKKRCLSIFKDHGVTPDEQWVQNLIEKSNGDARTIISEIGIELFSQSSTLEDF